VEAGSYSGSLMDITEKLRLENFLYWHAHYFYCGTVREWLQIDTMKCLRCDKSGENPECFAAGGRRD